MSDFNSNQRHAEYSQFSIGSETAGYKIDVTGYSGDAGEEILLTSVGQKCRLERKLLLYCPFISLSNKYIPSRFLQYY